MRQVSRQSGLSQRNIKGSGVVSIRKVLRPEREGGIGQKVEDKGRRIEEMGGKRHNR